MKGRELRGPILWRGSGRKTFKPSSWGMGILSKDLRYPPDLKQEEEKPSAGSEGGKGQCGKQGRWAKNSSAWYRKGGAANRNLR